MSVFVFRFSESGAGEVLFFDGRDLRPLPPPATWPDDPARECAWGARSKAARWTAWALAEKCGCPADLVGEVAPLLCQEWVALMPKSEQTIPEWVVQHEVIRLALRVMTDLNGN